MITCDGLGDFLAVFYGTFSIFSKTNFKRVCALSFSFFHVFLSFLSVLFVICLFSFCFYAILCVSRFSPYSFSFFVIVFCFCLQKERENRKPSKQR